MNRKFSYFTFGVSIFALVILANAHDIVVQSSGQRIESCPSSTTANSILFSPDGKNIISTWTDNSAKLWSTETGEVKHTFDVEDRVIATFAFSPDGKFIATGLNLGITVLWDSQTGKKLHSLALRRKLGQSRDGDYISSLFFTPDSKYILTNNFRRDTALWDVQTGKLIYTFEGFNVGKFSPNGKYLLTEAILSQALVELVKLWDVQTGQLLHTFEEATSGEFSADGKYLLTGGSGGTALVKLWEIPTGQLLQSFEAAKTGQFSSTGRYIVTHEYSHDQRYVNLWDAQTYKKLFVFENFYQDWKFSQDDRYLLIKGRDFIQDRTDIWDIESRTTAHAWRHGIKQVEFLADNIHVLLSYEQPSQAVTPSEREFAILVWNIEADTETAFYKFNMPVFVMAVSRDGEHALLDTRKTHNEHVLYLWDIKTGTLVHKLC
jgi:WD40 repeat protein